MNVDHELKYPRLPRRSAPMWRDIVSFLRAMWGRGESTCLTVGEVSSLENKPNA